MSIEYHIAKVFINESEQTQFGLSTILQRY